MFQVVREGRIWKEVFKVKQQQQASFNLFVKCAGHQVLRLYKWKDLSHLPLRTQAIKNTLPLPIILTQYFIENFLSP